MLPAYNLRRAAIASVTAMAIGLPAVPAFAFDPHEQGVIAGILGTILVGSIISQDMKRVAAQQQQAQPVYVQPQPVYAAPQPVYRRQTMSQSVSGTPAAYAFASYSGSERRAIQRRLAGFGYYRGAIDGSFGAGTYNAISSYARDQGQEAALANTRSAYGVYDGLIF